MYCRGSTEMLTCRKGSPGSVGIQPRLLAQHPDSWLTLVALPLTGCWTWWLLQITLTHPNHLLHVCNGKHSPVIPFPFKQDVVQNQGTQIRVIETLHFGVYRSCLSWKLFKCNHCLTWLKQWHWYVQGRSWLAFTTTEFAHWTALSAKELSPWTHSLHTTVSISVYSV